MNVKKIVLITFIFFNMVVLSADASIMYNGVDGLINVPSAYVKKPYSAKLGYFYTSSFQSMAGNVSLLNDMDFSYSRQRFDNNKDYNIYSTKIALLKEKVLLPAVAVGVIDLSNQFDRSYYVTTSKQGPFGFRLHLGARFSENHENAVYYGLEKQIRLSDDLKKMLSFMPVFNLMLEYDGNSFNYGAYVRNSKGMLFNIAFRDRMFQASIQYEF